VPISKAKRENGDLKPKLPSATNLSGIDTVDASCTRFESENEVRLTDEIGVEEMSRNEATESFEDESGKNEATDSVKDEFGRIWEGSEPQQASMKKEEEKAVESRKVERL
jgi:hypothetical protein